ncbi:hypothetical protein HYH03_007400 [Edaphochlamys debaryana]|uniref:SET domain-containing protein n=1 Tax=Edaphochlamys debaryana TaxID=47281 RepID=A0A835Y1S3_9CHLO|nr:hypothetical protein HYH03_007400 [Edaphochlamys debaryana]|eukprot:KAG2494343.1 hypothetical protein HYH03_007400 [Edaphochlamys debaryana]
MADWPVDALGRVELHGLNPSPAKAGLGDSTHIPPSSRAILEQQLGTISGDIGHEAGHEFAGGASGLSPEVDGLGPLSHLLEGPRAVLPPMHPHEEHAAHDSRYEEFMNDLGPAEGIDWGQDPADGGHAGDALEPADAGAEPGAEAEAHAPASEEAPVVSGGSGGEHQQLSNTSADGAGDRSPALLAGEQDDPGAGATEPDADADPLVGAPRRPDLPPPQRRRQRKKVYQRSTPEPEPVPEPAPASGNGPVARRMLRAVGGGVYSVLVGALQLFPSAVRSAALMAPTPVELWFRPRDAAPGSPLQLYAGAALRLYRYEGGKACAHLSRMTNLATQIVGSNVRAPGNVLSLSKLSDGRLFVAPPDDLAAAAPIRGPGAAGGAGRPQAQRAQKRRREAEAEGPDAEEEAEAAMLGLSGAAEAEAEEDGEGPRPGRRRGAAGLRHADPDDALIGADGAADHDGMETDGGEDGAGEEEAEEEGAGGGAAGHSGRPVRTKKPSLAMTKAAAAAAATEAGGGATLSASALGAASAPSRLRYLRGGIYSVLVGAMSLFPPAIRTAAEREPTVVELWYQPANAGPNAPLKPFRGAALRIYRYDGYKCVHLSRMTALSGMIAGVSAFGPGSVLSVRRLPDGRLVLGADDEDAGPSRAREPGEGAGGGGGAARRGGGRRQTAAARRRRRRRSGSGEEDAAGDGSDEEGLEDEPGFGRGDHEEGGMGGWELDFAQPDHDIGDGLIDGSGRGGGGLSGDAPSGSNSSSDGEGDANSGGEGGEEALGRGARRRRAPRRGAELAWGDEVDRLAQEEEDEAEAGRGGARRRVHLPRALHPAMRHHQLRSVGGGTYAVLVGALNLFPNAVRAAAAKASTPVELWYQPAAEPPGAPLRLYSGGALRVYGIDGSARRRAQLGRMTALFGHIAGVSNHGAGSTLSLSRLPDGRLVIGATEGEEAEGEEPSAGGGGGTPPPRGRRPPPASAHQRHAAASPPSPSVAAAATAALNMLRHRPRKASSSGREGSQGAVGPGPVQEVMPRRVERDPSVGRQARVASAAAPAPRLVDERAAGPSRMWWDGDALSLPPETVRVLPPAILAAARGGQHVPLVLWYRPADSPSALQLMPYDSASILLGRGGTALLFGAGTLGQLVTGSRSLRSGDELLLSRMPDGRCVVSLGAGGAAGSSSGGAPVSGGGAAGTAGWAAGRPPAGAAGAGGTTGSAVGPQAQPAPPSKQDEDSAVSEDPLIMKAPSRPAAPPPHHLPSASLRHLHGYLPPGVPLPPLQPGELRLCGMTFHPDLAPSVRRAMQEWETVLVSRLLEEGLGDGLADADPATAQISIPDPATLARLGLSRALICAQLAAHLGLTGDGAGSSSGGGSGWDAPLPTGALELGAGMVEPCEDAARGGAGLAAARRVPRSTVLGVLGGYVLTRAAAQRYVSYGFRHCGAAVLAELEREASAVGLRGVTETWQVLAGSFRLPFPQLKLVAEGSTAPSALEVSMLGYGNMAALVNDPRSNPRSWAPGNDVGDEDGAAAQANCTVLPVSVRGLVLPVLVALRDIAPGEQLLRDYGAEWWEAIAAPWEVLSAAQEEAGNAAAGGLGVLNVKQEDGSPM